MIHVDISNVATWFFEVNQEGNYTYSSFPIILSPWPVASFYYFTPRFINIHGKKEPYTGKTGRVKVLVQNERLDDELRSLYQHWENIDAAVYVQSVEPVLITNSETINGGGILLSLNENGAIATQYQVPHPQMGEIDPSWYYPVAFAISLAHCRNVEVRDRPVSRQQRRMAERTGKPAIIYKELVIDAFRKQVRYETQGDGGNEIKRALHICRGHFATYGDHNPLFGKYTGTFWRPMHVRGNKEAGEVKKSYKVERPK